MKSQPSPDIDVWDCLAETSRRLTPAQAAAGMVRYARAELGIGTPACGEVERHALGILRGTYEPCALPPWHPLPPRRSNRRTR